VFVPGAPIWIDAVPIWDGDERGPDGTTIQNTILYFGPDGQMIDKHGKLMRLFAVDRGALPGQWVHAARRTALVSRIRAW
jgi:hypothetical protein